MVSPGTRRRRIRSVVGRGPQRLWHLVVMFAAMALAATLTNSPGVWIADARLEYSTNPIDFLLGHGSIWDGSRGLGKTVTFYSPVVGAYEAALQLVGAEPWLIERLVHAALLLIAATGLATLLAVSRPRIGWIHLLAGLMYAFNPYTSQFLLPSGLFFSYALSPWFLYFYLRSTTDGDAGWRAAAWSALCIFAIGALNPAALVYSLLPVPIAAGYLVFVERSIRLRNALVWFVRAGILTLVASSGALVVLWFLRDDIALNLATTERPTVVSSRSSWVESWRGLGMWVTYFRESRGQKQSQSAAYFDNPIVVLASFGAPIAAGLSLALSRWRPRLFYAALVAMSVPIMVGLWPVDSPSPLGRVFDWGFENAVLVRGLRTTYKAGAVLSIGVAVLGAVGIASLLQRPRSGSLDERYRVIAGATAAWVLVAMVVVAAFPFWTGHLYNSDDGYEELPDYWGQALDWINAQPDDGRVLVLPGVIRTRYRWGYVNDNLFHGLLDKPLVSHQSIPPPGTPLTADVALAMDEYLASPGYREGTLGPILRRLGVRWVLFQNDVEWESVGVPRPSHFDPIRDDPDLVRARTFGTPGENTSSNHDGLAVANGETRLPPVEIYELADAQDTIRVTSDPPVIVAGAGDSWPQLAQQGILDNGPVMYVGTATDDDLVAALRASSRVVVTDGSRRRYLQVRTGRMAISHTLALDEATPRAPQSPFDDSASQTVAVYADAMSIEASATGNGVTPFDPSQRPANAFDEAPGTKWAVSRRLADGAYLDVELKEPTSIAGLSVMPYLPARSPRVDRVYVELISSDGSSVSRNASLADTGDDRWLPVMVEQQDVSRIRIGLEGLSGLGNSAVGISEVRVLGRDGPLDFREFLLTPRDLEFGASRNTEVASALEGADVSYSFRRNIGTGNGDEETEIRRVFWAPKSDEVDVVGTVQLSPRTPDVIVDRIVGAEVGAYGSERARGVENGWGINAVDGDLSTSWLAPPERGATLTVRPPDRPLETVEFILTTSRDDAGGTTEFSTVDDVSVTAAGANGTVVLELRADDAVCSTLAGGGSSCTESFVAVVPRDTYETIELGLGLVRPSGDTDGSLPVAVSEVNFDGVQSADDATRIADTCLEAFEIDGLVHTARLTGSRAELLDQQAVPFESCSTLSLGRGEHRFGSGPAWSGAVSDLMMASVAQRPEIARDDTASVTVIEQSPTRVVLDLTAPDGAYLIGPGSYHVGWTANVDGVELGRAVPRDSLSAWRVPALDQARVVLTFVPQRTYELALALSSAGVAICLYLVARGRRS